MKRSILFAAVLTVLVASAAAADDKNVSIAFAFNATSPSTFIGTYTLSGAIDETGPAEATAGVRVNDEGVLLLYSNKTMHLRGGDIHLFVEGPLTSTGDSTFSVIGKWQLTGGTGVYADIKGHGKTAIVGDFATGEVSGAYTGKVNVK